MGKIEIERSYGAGAINMKQLDFNKLVSSYRYGSFLITSLFYLTKGSSTVLIYKLAVVIALYIVTRIITGMYASFAASPRKLKSAILCESLLITLLLVPTGGINSPFIWYALNPTLVAVRYLSPYFCWLNLTFYMSIAILIPSDVFNSEDLFGLVTKNSQLIMIFILTTLLIQPLVTLSNKLTVANHKQNESMEHIMSLYRVLEAFTKEDDISGFFQTLTDYTAKLTKANLSFFWQNTDKPDGGSVFTNEGVPNDLKAALAEVARERVNYSTHESETVGMVVNHSVFQGVLIKSPTRLYGVLGIEQDNGSQLPGQIFRRQLVFLADIGAIILDRFSMESTNDRLILLEERNRIANEIHDSVSQRIFSISCSLHNLRSTGADLSDENSRDELDFLSRSTNEVMRELRQAIYSLSTNKSGEKILFSSIKSFLSDLARLNDISISVDLNGEEEQLSAKLKRCLYRIICEATGNALKHGRSTEIRIWLHIGLKHIRLNVEDNGVGFHSDSMKQENMGLGIRNMRNTVQQYGGSILLTNLPQGGTKLTIEMPKTSEVSHCNGEGCEDENKVGSY